MTSTTIGPPTVVEEALDALNRDDYDAYSALLAEDVHYEGSRVIPGRAAARQVDRAFFGTLSRHWRRIERSVVNRDTVVVWLRFGGTTKEGREFEVDLCDVVRVQDGRITSLRMYGDWPGPSAALGAGA
jgi:ketosteroid isomerase-like protein